MAGAIKGYINTKEFADAIFAGDAKKIKEFLRAGANPNSPLPNGRMLLTAAAAAGKITPIRLLLEAGADINGSNGFDTPLYAAAMGNKFALKLLLAQGADPNIPSFSENQTVLHGLAKDGDEDRIRYFLAAGADPGKTNSFGWTPLHTAAANGCVGSAQLLIEAGADINARDNDGRTPLSRSVLKYSEDMPELLLKHGADPNIPDFQGDTPLIYMTKHDTLKMIELFIKAGTDLNFKNRRGMAAVHHAAEAGNAGKLQCLYDAGADLHIKDNKGHTPIEILCNKWPGIYNAFMVYYDQSETKRRLMLEDSKQTADTGYEFDI